VCGLNFVTDVFVLGAISTIGAFYSTYIAIRVIVQLYRESTEAKAAGDEQGVQDVELGEEAYMDNAVAVPKGTNTWI
jgi:hypothetical protein